MKQETILARQRSKFGGCLEDILVSGELSEKIPFGKWLFISEVKHLVPSWVFKKYSMIYRAE